MRTATSRADGAVQQGRATFDTKYACHLLDESVSSALKGKTDGNGNLTGAPGQVEMYLGVKPGYALDMSTADVFEHTLEDLGTYGGKDAAYTWRLREFHIERFRKFPKLARFFKYVTMPGTELLTQIEFNGFPIDVAWIAETMGTTRARIAEIEARFVEIMEDGGCGAWDCNGSACEAHWDWQTDDLIQMLFDVAGIPVMSRTAAKGQASANDEAMIDTRAEFVRLLAEEPENAEYQGVLDCIDLVREWGDLTKDLQFMEAWDKYIWSDGRIHSTYHWEMSTGRTSCRDPNAQQWPKRLKRAVKAREGWTFIAVDESQAELRLIAEDAREEVMLSIYAQDGDIHRTTAAAIMKKPASEITSKERQKASAENRICEDGWHATVATDEHVRIDQQLSRARPGTVAPDEPPPTTRSWARWCAPDPCGDGRAATSGNAVGFSCERLALFASPSSLVRAKGAELMSPVIRNGEFEIYQADIRQPRKASLMVYQDSNCWLTIADSAGAETTILVNLDDEGDRKFADQLRMVAGVLAVLMSADDGGDEEARPKGTRRTEQCRDI